MNPVPASLELLGTRISAVADLYPDRKSAAVAAGVSTDQLARYIRGENQPTFRVLLAMAGPVGVSLDWLATGDGPMLSAKRELVARDGQAPSAVPEAGAVGLPEGRFTLLPRYDVRAAAGEGALVHSEQIVDFLAFQTDWLRRVVGVEPRHLALISAVGDSMVPTIKDGDLLLVDLAPELRDGRIYALADDGMIVIKRVQRPGDGTVRLISDNAAYAPRELSREEAASLRVVGRVVWHGGVI